MSRVKDSFLVNLIFYEIMLAFGFTFLSFNLEVGLIILAFTAFLLFLLPFIMDDPRYHVIDGLDKQTSVIFSSKNQAMLAAWLRSNIDKAKQYSFSTLPSTMEPQHKVKNEGPTRNNASEFKLKKKGRWQNIILLLFGAATLLFIVHFLSNLIGVDLFEFESIWVIIGFVIIIDLIYYLPTLLYYNSNFGKFLIFLLNTLVSWTLIGWIILLLYVISQNTKYRYHSELIHKIRRK